MSAAFQTFGTQVQLHPAPIEPAWIRDGRPVARNAVVSRSADAGAYTMVWDCTAGTFDWFYDCDETVHIIEGAVVLTDAGNQARRLGPGDAVFFPKGAQVRWTVDTYVKKLAFMRQTLPRPVSLGLRTARRLERLSGAAPKVATLAVNRPVLSALRLGAFLAGLLAA